MKWWNSSISSYSVQHKSFFAHILSVKNFLWPIDRNQLGVTTPSQSGAGSDGNEGTEMQSVYSTAPPNIAIFTICALETIGEQKMIVRIATIQKTSLLISEWSFFQEAVASILLYGCTTWTLTKRLEKKLDGNYTRMLRAILNKSWRQHPTRHQLYGHLPPITKTIQVRRTRHAGHCMRSRYELISDVLLWIPTHGQAKTGRPVRTYIQQLCENTGCSSEDLPEAMNDREKWRESVRDIRATSSTWWWWWWWW